MAVGGTEIVGVLLTGQEWLEDLWIARRYRRQGIGARLLQIAEDEIARRGHARARLRAVTENLPARQF